MTRSFVSEKTEGLPNFKESHDEQERVIGRRLLWMDIEKAIVGGIARITSNARKDKVEKAK